MTNGLLDHTAKRKCPLCGGSGMVSDDREIGSAMQTHRVTNGLTLRELGHKLGFSAAYISDLEHGRRAWNAKKIEDFLKACQ